MVFDRRSVNATIHPEFSKPGFYPLDPTHGPLMTLLATHLLVPFESQSGFYHPAFPMMQKMYSHAVPTPPPPPPMPMHIPPQLIPYFYSRPMYPASQQPTASMSSSSIPQSSYTNRKPVQIPVDNQAQRRPPHRIPRKQPQIPPRPVVRSNSDTTSNRARRVRFSEEAPTEHRYIPDDPLYKTGQDDDEEEDDQWDDGYDSDDSYYYYHHHDGLFYEDEEYYDQIRRPWSTGALEPHPRKPRHAADHHSAHTGRLRGEWRSDVFSRTRLHHT